MLRAGHLLDGRRVSCAGIVDEEVEPAELSDGLLGDLGPRYADGDLEATVSRVPYVPAIASPPGWSSAISNTAIIAP